MADHFALREFFGFHFVIGGNAGLDGSLNRFEQRIEFEGLGEVVERPVAGGRHDGLNGASGGHEDDAAVRVAIFGGDEDVESGAVIDIDVGDDERPGSGGDAVHRVAGVGDGFDGKAFHFQKSDDGGAYSCVILYHEDWIGKCSLFVHLARFRSRLKREPLPGSDSTSITPPCEVTICSTIESPIPVPCSPDCSARLVR